MFKGEMLKAIEDFNHALELNPKLAWSYCNRGLVKVLMGNESEAQKDFGECLRLKPELKTELDQKIDLARDLRRIGKSEE
jgi:tetratricopeptide (TPR) repeat protein